MKKMHLLTPGPTPVPANTLLEMAKPVFHHRTSTFKQMFAEVNEGLRYVFKTKNPVLTFASSGTGAMEASICGFLSPGDHILTVNGGKFGERFGLLGKAYGAQVTELIVEYGEEVSPAAIEKALAADPSIKAVYTTLCETSTGILTDIQAIGKIVAKTDAILVVDAISGLGADDLRTDEWHVDLGIAGSQKALMLPPGLAFLSVSPKAEVLAKKSTMPKFYFDVLKALKTYGADDTPYTPAVTLIRGLAANLKDIKAEGIDEVLARHSCLAEGMRAALKAIGITLFAKGTPSNGVTSACVPEGVDGASIVKKLRDIYGISIAGGQGHVKGKIFRIAHMGDMDMFDVIVGISALEMVLAELGYGVQKGKGVGAFEEIMLKYGIKG